MAAYLKQSVSVTIRLGPYLDASDGVTEETGLTPTVELSKNHAAFGARNSGAAITHDSNGWYAVPLDAGVDTATLGLLIVKSDDSTTYLPVYREFIVVPANVYDSLVAGSDTLQSDTTQWNGSNVVAPNSAGVPRVDLDMVEGVNVSTSTAQLGVNAVTVADKTGYNLAAGAIGSSTFAAGAINAAAIATDAIDADAIADAAITAGSFAAGAIDAAAIAADAIGSSEFAQAAADKIWASTTRAITDKAGFGLADSAITSAKFASGAINAAVLNADTDTYQAKTWLIDDDTGFKDRYMVVFFKNGQPITSGITNPTIQVISASNGTDLVAETDLTEISTTGLYKYDEDTNRIEGGSAYVVKTTATIASSTRTWYQPVGRDS